MLMNSLIDVYSLIVLVAVFLSWAALDSRQPFVALVPGLTEPVLAPIRRLLPAMGGLDLSPMILLILLRVLQRAL